jgi:peptide/nickel transport system substrate-binding protein
LKRLSSTWPSALRQPSHDKRIGHSAETEYTHEDHGDQESVNHEEAAEFLPMGFGRRAAGQEVDHPVRATARFPTLYGRRTILWFWCGVFFCLTSCTSLDQPVPPRTGVLTIGFPESGVDRGGLGAGSLITNSSLEGLTQVNISVDGRALPRLAETWVWENEGQRLRLKLRDKVVFHDGTPLTASVAAEALKSAIALPGNRALYPSLSDIAAIRVDGPSDLLLDLSQPSAFLPEELDLPISHGPPSVGTGPFRLVARDKSAVVLERFDRYYLGAPEIAQIVIRPFETLRTAWASLLRGDVDMVTDVPPEALDFIRNDAIQVVTFARSYQFLIAFNSGKPPFASPVVRRALNVAVDRDALIANVLQGQGQPSTGPLWPRHWAYDASVRPYGFDARFAVTLLEAAGYHLQGTSGGPNRPPARLRFTCLLPADFSLLERIGLEVQKQLYDVGIDMQFEVVDLSEYDARLREGRFDAVLVDLISGPTFGRPFIFWRSGRNFKGLNVYGYENSQVEQLFGILRTSTNEAAVRTATSRLQRAFLDDPPALFLAWNSRARAVRRTFEIVAEPGRDPLLTIRQWTENTDRQPVSTQ